MKKEYTQDDLIKQTIKARDEVYGRHYAILNYILNKNSHSLADGGIDHKKLWEELQDFEQYLVEHL